MYVHTYIYTYVPQLLILFILPDLHSALPDREGKGVLNDIVSLIRLWINLSLCGLGARCMPNILVLCTSSEMLSICKEIPRGRCPSARYQ